MNSIPEITEEEIEKTFKKLDHEAKAGGYKLNPDEKITKMLIKGLLINQKRYGYQSCPCRLASGNKKADLDIICPCDYRDPDLNEYNTCFCALYVTEAVINKIVKIKPIPERRTDKNIQQDESNQTKGIKVWRCKVCGYLCAREDAPHVCPICKAEKERFEIFSFH